MVNGPGRALVAAGATNTERASSRRIQAADAQVEPAKSQSRVYLILRSLLVGVEMTNLIYTRSCVFCI